MLEIEEATQRLKSDDRLGFYYKRERERERESERGIEIFAMRVVYLAFSSRNR